MTVTPGESNTTHAPSISISKIRSYLALGAFALFAIIVFGLIWLYFLSPARPTGFGWYLFGFASGLSMIVLPCTLPLAFVIVPLSMGKGLAKGLGIALSFGLGVALMLSVYGIAAAFIGGQAVDKLGAPLESVKNWVYFIAGIFAYLFALGSIGLLRFRMPTYSGAAPGVIQQKGDFLKAFLLGVFLGNIGVGCPHPATPLLLIEIASSGEMFYGWSLFLTHAIGRVVPLLFLAFLGILGVNGLSWLVARRVTIERATGWAMVFVAGFILTLGFFTHDWWVNSGIHTTLESITQERRLIGLVNERLGTNVAHGHGPEEGSSLFGFPLVLGNWVLVALWVIPVWSWIARERRRIRAIPPERTVPEHGTEKRILVSKSAFAAALTLLLASVFIYVLPDRFLNHTAREHAEITSVETADEHDTGSGMDEMHMEMTEMMGMMGMEEEHTHTGEEAAGDGDSHEDRTLTDEAHAYDALYHEEGDVKEGVVSRLEVLLSPTGSPAPTRLLFRIVDLPTSEPVTTLELNHARYLHVIGIREDLNGFFHVHPIETSPGVWVYDHMFTLTGTYKIWSDFKYAGQVHTIGHERVSVAGLYPDEGPVLPPSFPYPRVDDLGSYRMYAEYPEFVIAGTSTSVEFFVTDASDAAVPTEPYLEAGMHLAVIREDLTDYQHTHPDEAEHMLRELLGGLNTALVDRAFAHGAVDDQHEEAISRRTGPHASFSVTFPRPGLYKLIPQFRPFGISLPEEEALVAEFYVNVVGSVPFEPPPRGVHTFVSIALMIALSFVVRRYIEGARGSRT